MIPAAAWYRVSSDDQVSANQKPEVERFASHHGYTVVREYIVTGSAFDGGSPDYKDALAQALEDAWRGEFKIFIIWALDRLTREGAEVTLRLIRQFRERGVTIVSVNDSWLNTSSEITDAFVGFAATMARNESARRGHRIRAGMARRKAEGKHVGRKPGATDKKSRKSRQAADQARLRKVS